MKYSGALHIHSTHSYDGKLSLSQLKVMFVSEGLSFACMTEHADTLTPESAAAFVAECRALSDTTFIFIPGFEVPYKNTHILHIGCDSFINQQADENTLRDWRTVTPLVILAHPVRNNYIVDAKLSTCLDGIEIWNQQYDGKLVPRVKSAELLEQLRKKSSLFATGGIDLHRPEHFGHPFTWVECENLTEKGIISELKAGRFTFGSDQRIIAAAGHWRPTIFEYIIGTIVIATITLGKIANAFLAAFGITLPKKWRQFIRERV